jgi:glycosyltransferase involved in cell wall biosynthesis
MVARLAAPARRPELLVAALPSLRARHPSAHVVFVGDGPLTGELAAQASSLGVADAVILLGDRTDVPDQLRAAAIAVHACRYDGCSLGVLEAMASGRPVVASRVGGMDEVVLEGSTGQLCSEDPEEWAAVLGSLLDDGLLAEAMGAAGRDRARARYARERMALAVTDVYRRVAQPLGPMGR